MSGFEPESCHSKQSRYDNLAINLPENMPLGKPAESGHLVAIVKVNIKYIHKPSI
jgi:hypothetical protein